MGWAALTVAVAVVVAMMFVVAVYVVAMVVVAAVVVASGMTAMRRMARVRMWEANWQLSDMVVVAKLAGTAGTLEKATVPSTKKKKRRGLVAVELAQQRTKGLKTKSKKEEPAAADREHSKCHLLCPSLPLPPLQRTTWVGCCLSSPNLVW